MGLGGGTITWDSTDPADSKNQGLGAGDIRSMKTAVQTAMNSEHNWPSTGGANTGYHLFGSCRPYFGTQSAVSSSGTDARLMITSDTSRVYNVGSTGALFVGGSQVPEMGISTGALTCRWVEESGTTIYSTAGGTITFASAYSGAPYLFFGVMADVSAGVMGFMPYASAVGASSFNLHVSAISNGGSAKVVDALAMGVSLSGLTVYWRSLGTRAV